MNFSILFSRFLVIFTIIILNSFSDSLPIYSWFIWTSVFLVCSFICAVFLCLFIIFFKLLCLRSPLFWGFKESWILSLKNVELFLPFGFCSPKMGALYRVKFVLSFCCCCLFVLWWARLNEVVILFADNWVCILLLLLDEASCTRCYWWLIDARPCIQVVLFFGSSHYLILSRVCCLAV